MRTELSGKRRKERERVEALLKDVDSWTDAEKLRSYLRAVERSGLRSSEPAWFTWAERIADALDPLVQSKNVDWEEPEPFYGFRS